MMFKFQIDKATVYPRDCGEHPPPPVSPAIGAGLSPRLRGTHHALQLAIDSLRFIPAPAGNTERQDTN